MRKGDRPREPLPGAGGAAPRRSPTKRDFNSADIPPVRDPSWPARAAPLLLHLAERPRPVDEVIASCQERGETAASARQVLAWLSFTGQAAYDENRAIWRTSLRSLDTSPRL